MAEVEYPIYYLGCWDEAGHYLHDPTGKSHYYSIGPFTLALLDGGPFMPQKATLTYPALEDERNSMLTWSEGWTVLSMWDRSVDARPGSHATFVARGKYLEGAMWGLIKLHFPKIAQRLKPKHPVYFPEPIIQKG